MRKWVAVFYGRPAGAPHSEQGRKRVWLNAESRADAEEKVLAGFVDVSELLITPDDGVVPGDAR
jgi:hypothetical protein